MSERRTLRTRGEVIEEYSRDFPAEIVETYSRPLPGAIPEKAAVSAAKPRKKRRVLKGLLILLAIAAAIVLLFGGIQWLLWQAQSPDDWQEEDDYYYYDREQDAEQAPITIPTAEPDASVRLTLETEPGYVLSAPEVYRKVHDAVVTVAVDLGDNRMSIGTGVLFREDGYLLTNHHVVAGGTACTVLLANGQPYEAKFIASDANYDLAVLKIDGENLPTAEFLDSDTLQVGDAVYAIGTPLDLEMSGTFTNGIVSSVNREMQLDGQTSMPMIQTNAALNNGNSGGPLISDSGQVVGINFMKMYARYSTVEGLGFAIPSVQAERVVNDLLAYGALQPEPVLGVSVRQIPTQLTDTLWGLEVWADAGNAAVTPGGAADRAGIQTGDYILAVDGQETLSSGDVLKARWKHHVGDEITLTIWRDGRILDVTLELTDALEK